MSPAPASAAPAPSGGELRIDRLALRVSGLDEDAARALARLVAEGLAPSLLRAPGLAGLDHLKVEVQADAAAAGSADATARRVIDAVGRALARDRVAGGPDGEAVP